MTQKIENFSFVQASLHWTFRALTEIYFFNKERSAKEIELVDGPPFEFYRISLHYMFIMEYTKLMESKNDRHPTNHVASLEKLSYEIYKEKSNGFRELHDKNLEILTLIKSSDFYIELKGDRDKKFGHADSDHPMPFSFHSFNDNEIKIAFEQLNMFKEIMDNCTKLFNYGFQFRNTDPRTDNFIKFHARYKEYYFNNYFEAISRGYGLF